MTNSRRAFWQALVFTFFIFGIGMAIGFLLENSREKKVEISSIQSELNLLDEQVRDKAISEFGISCSLARESTFRYADRIYNEALKLEKFDSSAKFYNTLKIIHKRYDLLRMMLWAQSIEIKKNCSDFHTVVYLFQYDTENINTRAQQTAFSRLLTDLKNKYPDEILLVPIAANLDLDSVELAMQAYGVKKAPAILIDEDDVFYDIINFEELENLVFQSNKT